MGIDFTKGTPPGRTNPPRFPVQAPPATDPWKPGSPNQPNPNRPSGSPALKPKAVRAP